MVKKIKTFWSDLDDKVKKIAGLVSAAIVIITACVSVCTWASDRISALVDSRIDSLQQEVESINKQSEAYALDTELSLARLDLMNLIADYPENRDDILKAAERYFVELRGNYVAEQIFFDWASEHDVDVSYIRAKIGEHHD